MYAWNRMPWQFLVSTCPHNTLVSRAAFVPVCTQLDASETPEKRLPLAACVITTVPAYYAIMACVA